MKLIRFILLLSLGFTYTNISLYAACPMPETPIITTSKLEWCKNEKVILNIDGEDGGDFLQDWDLTILSITACNKYGEKLYTGEFLYSLVPSKLYDNLDRSKLKKLELDFLNPDPGPMAELTKEYTGYFLVELQGINECSNIFGKEYREGELSSIILSIANEEDITGSINIDEKLLLENQNYTLQINNVAFSSYQVEIIQDDISLKTIETSTYNSSLDRYEASINTKGLSGKCKIIAKGISACGLTKTYLEINREIVSTPSKPTGSTECVTGSSYTYSITNGSNNVTYMWEYGLNAIEVSRTNNSIVLKYKNVETDFGYIRVRAMYNGIYGEYSPYSEIIRVSGITKPPTEIKGIDKVCVKSGDTQSFRYLIKNISAVTEIEWAIEGSGVTIIQNKEIPYEAWVTVPGGISSYTVSARQKIALWSDWKAKQVTVSSSPVAINFEGVNSCYGQGEIPILGIQPEGGKTWIQNYKRTATIKALKYYQVESANGTLTESSTTNSLGDVTHGYYIDNYLTFNLTDLPADETIRSATLTLTLNGTNDYSDRHFGIWSGSELSIGNDITGYGWYSGKNIAYLIEDYNRSTDPSKIIIDVKHILQGLKGKALYLVGSSDKLEIYSDGINAPSLDFVYYEKNTIPTNSLGWNSLVEYVYEGGTCSTTKTENIVINPKPNITFDDVDYCIAEMPVKLNTAYSSSPGTGIYKDSPFVVDGIFSVKEVGYLNNVTVPVIYRFEDNNGCYNEVVADIKTHEPSVGKIESKETVCLNETFNINSSNTYSSYQWTIDGAIISTSKNFSYTPTKTGILKVILKYTDNFTCEKIVSKIINVLPNPTLTLNDRSECTGSYVSFYPDKITNSNANSISYKWSSGETTQYISRKIRTGETYGLTITNEYGCSATDQMTITPLAQPTASVLGDPEICDGENGTFEATYNPNYTYKWNTGATGNKLTIRPSDYNKGFNQYTVFVTDKEGCVYTNGVQLLVNENPSISLLDKTACQNEEVSIQAPPGFSSYKWSNGVIGTNSIIHKAVSNTTISCTVTDTKGCNTTDNMSLNVVSPEIFSLESMNTDEYCYGTSVILKGPEGMNNYKWSNGANTQSNTFNIYSSGNYSLTINDKNGCEVSDDIFIKSRELPNVTVNNSTVCKGEKATLIASPSIYSRYVWENGISGIQNIVTGEFNKTYTVTVYDNIGCHAQSSGTVSVNPEPAFSLPNKSICKNEVVSLTISGGPFFSYNWSTGETSSSITVVAEESAKYSCNVTNTFGCSSEKNMELSVKEPLALNLVDIDACQGESVTMEAPTGFQSYAWSNGVFFRTTNVTAENTNNYTLNVVDHNGCKNSDKLTVFSNPYPHVVIPDFGINEGGTGIIAAPSGYAEYLWSTGHTTESIVVSPTKSTDYWVRIETEKGCSAYDTINVSIYELPKIEIPDVTICQGESVKLEAPEGYMYSWSTGEETRSIIVKPDITTVYNLEIQNKTGGKGGTQIVVTVKQLPNASLENKTVCFNETIELTTPTNSSYSYKWSDSNESTNKYSFVATSNKTITVTVSDNDGCKKNASSQIKVYNPSAEFSVSRQNVEFGGPVQFFLANIQDIDSIYNWKFGDGFNSNEISPTHNYYILGKHDVELEVISKLGCKASLIKKEIINISNDGTPINEITMTGLKIYPTVVSDNLFINTMDYDSENEIKVSLFSSNGSQLLTQKINTKSINKLDLKSFNPGVYMVYTDVNGIVSISKIIKE